MENLKTYTDYQHPTRYKDNNKQGGGKLQSVNETTISKTLKRLFNK